MSTPTDENRDLLTVVAYMRAAEGRTEQLRAALEALIEPTSKEEGYVNYDLHQGVDDPPLLHLLRELGLRCAPRRPPRSAPPGRLREQDG